MRDVFITKIHIDKVRHLQNIDIELSGTERKHLILTGKNGSGKTSLLLAMRDNIRNEQQLSAARKHGAGLNSIGQYPGLYPAGLSDDFQLNSLVSLEYSCASPEFIDTVIIYLAAERNKPLQPKAIEQIDIKGKTVVTRDASRDFLKYILSLDYQLYGAQSDRDNVRAESLRKWFADFEDSLREIYNCPELRLKRDAKNLAFRIEMPGRETFALNEMADGYAAFLDIYMELLMRLENENGDVEYDAPAIAMIDEIETHLHVELQRRALPFLTRFFPNVQFIVATHSPFVISSLANAVVYDLEKLVRLEDASLYSYDEIVEGFYEVGLNSQELMNKFERFKELCGQKSRTNEETHELAELTVTLEAISPANTSIYPVFKKYRRAEKWLN